MLATLRRAVTGLRPAAASPHAFLSSSSLRTVKLPPQLSSVLENFRMSKSISRNKQDPELMQHRVSRVLLLCSDYDSYTFEEEGQLKDLMYTEYSQHGLRKPPQIDRVTSVEQVIEALKTHRYDLLVSLLRTQSLEVGRHGNKGLNLELFVEQVKKHDHKIPILLFALNPAELSTLDSRVDEALKINVNKREQWLAKERQHGLENTWLWPFLWQGNMSLFTSMFKAVEDRINVNHDVQYGSQVIILVEDNVKFYSQYLPMVYSVLIEHATALDKNMSETERIIRMQSRPKVLLCTNYEEAMEIYSRYKNHTMAVITDAAFSRDGTWDPAAGVDFARMIRAEQPLLDVVIQSSDVANKTIAEELGCTFLNKDSPSLSGELYSFFQHTLFFGPLCFTSDSGTVIARANDISSLMRVYATLPDDVIDRIGRTNMLSKWFRARAEPTLAKAFSTSQYPADFENFAAQGYKSRQEALRHWVIAAMFSLRNRITGTVSDYNRADEMTLITKVGKGSLGGKGKGFRMLHTLVDKHDLQHLLPEVDLRVPQCLILAADVFDRFIESNELLQPILRAESDAQIEALFDVATLPSDAMEALKMYATRHEAVPLAVRSSSLFEDAFQQPFAGIYKSFMLHNSAPTVHERVATLVSSVKSVYASVFTKEARSYAEASQLNVTGEKMAVIIQPVAGRMHSEGIFAPSFAGVASAVDFYPRPHTTTDDGTATIAPGLGSSVVDGQSAVSWSLGDPDHVVGQVDKFTVLPLPSASGMSKYGAIMSDSNLDKHAMSEVDALGLLQTVSPLVKAPVVEVQTFDVHGEKVVFTRRAKPAAPSTPADKSALINMPLAQIIRGDAFPLSQVLSFILQMGTLALSCPVEVEFAVNLRKSPEERHELHLLQIRPMPQLIPDVRSTETLRFSYLPSSQHAAVTSANALGHGRFSNLSDVIFVPPEAFSPDRAGAIAREIGELNSKLKKQGRKYILVGPGRWGTADSNRGIPVDWSQIDGASFIVESTLEGSQAVQPSQGAHFFQNIMSFGLGYMTVDTGKGESSGAVDYDWMKAMPASDACASLKYTKHIQMEDELEVVCDGLSRRGVIMKPGFPFEVYVLPIDAMMALTAESGGS